MKEYRPTGCLYPLDRQRHRECGRALSDPQSSYCAVHRAQYFYPTPGESELLLILTKMKKEATENGHKFR